MKEEIWKDIKGYEGLYQVSNLGRVKSIISEKILKTYYTNKGYLKVILYKNSIQHNLTVHRLVANAFIENPYNMPCVNHINGIKTDNKLENLEWCTFKYNINHAIQNDLKSYKKIICIETNKIYKSVYEASREMVGTPSNNIRACLKNPNRTAYGFHWKYVN